MPRPTGWKPLSYQKIGEICGHLFLGLGSREIAQKLGVPRNSVISMRKTLLKMRAIDSKFHSSISPELDSKIRELVRTTKLTNHEIAKRCDLRWTHSVRVRRKAYYEELRRTGQPVPLCKCGDEFAHAHRCRCMRSYPRPVSEFDREEVIAELLAGARLEVIRDRYGLSIPAANKLLRSLRPAQRKKRNRYFAHQRQAVRRRNAARPAFTGLHSRLDSVLSRSLAPEVRAEVLQEMAVAILSGSIAEERAIQQLRSFTSKAYRQLSDPWRNVSLDAERDGCSLGDLIEDESALSAFDELDEMMLA